MEQSSSSYSRSYSSSSSRGFSSSSSSVITNSSLSLSSSSSIETGLFSLLGTSTSSPSLVIDIANADEMLDITTGRFGGSLPDYLRSLGSNRLRGDISIGDAVWGFSQSTHGTSSRIGSAVAIAGSRLSIKIATKGHGVGLLFGRVAFSRTKLTVSLIDILHGVEESILFTNFSSADDDPSRFILWKLPETNADSQVFFNQYGIHGFYILKISEESDYFWRADWTDPVDLDKTLLPQPSSSYLHVSVLSWKQILQDMYGKIRPLRNVAFASKANFLLSSPGVGDSALMVFNDSCYANFLHGASLTDEEKSSIIRNASLGLVSSQLPILTADNPSSPVLGIGIKEIPTNPVYVPVPTLRAQQSPLVVKQRNPSFYGLNGAAAAVNSIYDLNDIVSGHGYSSQIISDPTRIWHLNGSNSKMLFSASGSSLSGAFAANNTPSSSIGVIIEEEIPVIGSVSIKLPKAPLPHYAIVEVDIVKNQEAVSSIGFGMAVDDRAYSVYSEMTGKTRRFSFDLSNENVSETSILYARVGVGDFDGRVRFYYAVCPLSLLGGTPAVFNIRAYPRTDSSGLVDIYYDAIDLREKSRFTVSISQINSRQIGDVGVVSSGCGRRVSVSPNSELYASPELIAISLLSGFPSGETQTGPLVTRTGIATPKVTLEPISDRFSVYDHVSLKNLDLEVTSGIRYIDHFSSVDSSGFMSSLTTSGSSESNSSQSLSTLSSCSLSSESPSSSSKSSRSSCSSRSSYSSGGSSPSSSSSSSLGFSSSSSPSSLELSSSSSSRSSCTTWRKPEQFPSPPSPNVATVGVNSDSWYLIPRGQGERNEDGAVQFDVCGLTSMSFKMLFETDPNIVGKFDTIQSRIKIFINGQKLTGNASNGDFIPTPLGGKAVQDPELQGENAQNTKYHTAYFTQFRNSVRLEGHIETVAGSGPDDSMIRIDIIGIT